MVSIDLSTWGGLTLAILPEVVVSAAAMVLLVVAAFRHHGEADQRLAGRGAIVGLLAGAVALLFISLLGRPAGLATMVSVDPFRAMSSGVILLGGVLTVLASLGYVGRERILAPEYYVLLLLATVGALFMCSSVDLIAIFLGLELMSVSVYILAGIDRRSGFSAEAALKYFLIGAFASGFLLYGIALIYGATGTTNLTLIDFQVGSMGLQSNKLILAGLALLLIGFGFKVAAVPFHMWAPDVYDGAPTPVTAFMAAAVKAAGFAALARVFAQGFGRHVELWQAGVWWLAALTMLLGNLIALTQTQLKRMLAYSSVAHAGYLLTAIASGTALGGAALLFYIFAYTLMTVGAFAVLGALGRDGERGVRIDDLAGLARRRPWVAAATTVFMLSLLGFPGTAGFIGKWYILAAVIQAHQGALAVLLVGASVLSAGYYLPVIMAMYMRPEQPGATDIGRLPGGTRWVVAVAATLLLLFGVWPNRVLDLARSGGQATRPNASFTVSE